MPWGNDPIVGDTVSTATIASTPLWGSRDPVVTEPMPTTRQTQPQRPLRRQPEPPAPQRYLFDGAYYEFDPSWSEDDVAKWLEKNVVGKRESTKESSLREMVQSAVARRNAERREQAPGQPATGYKAPLDIARRRAQQAEREAVEGIVEALPGSGNAFMRDVYGGLATGGADFQGTVARFIRRDPRKAEEYSQFSERLERTLAEKDEDSVAGQRLNRALRGSIRSMVTMSGGTVIAGPYGAIGSAAVVEAGRAIPRAEAAGLEGLEKASYVGVKAANEAAWALLFQRLGFGGAESMLAGEGMRSATKGVAKELLKQTGAELVEENITELTHNAIDTLSTVDKKALSSDRIGNTVFDTTLQTAMTMGLINSATMASAIAIANEERKSQSSIADWLKQLDAGTIEALQEASTFLTARAWRDVGLPADRSSGRPRTPNTTKRMAAWEYARALKQLDAEEQARETEHASAVQIPKTQVREEEGGPDVRGPGQEQVSTEQEGEGAPTPQVSVGPPAQQPPSTPPPPEESIPVHGTTAEDYDASGKWLGTFGGQPPIGPAQGGPQLVGLGPETTGVRTEKIDEQRIYTGLPPIPPPTSETTEQWHHDAAAAVMQDPGYVPDLVDALKNRAPELERITTIINQHIAGLNEEWKAGRGDLNAIADATLAASNMKTAWGRFGVALQMEYTDQHSLPALMERAQRAVGGRPLEEGELEAVTKQAEHWKALAEQNEAEAQRQADLRVAARERSIKNDAIMYAAGEAGVDPKKLEKRAKELIQEEARRAEDYNLALAQVRKRSGLTKRKVESYLKRNADIRAEHTKLDEIAPQLVRDFSGSTLFNVQVQGEEDLRTSGMEEVDAIDDLIDLVTNPARTEKDKPDWRDYLGEAAEDLELEWDYTVERLDEANQFAQEEDWGGLDRGEDAGEQQATGERAKRPRKTKAQLQKELGANLSNAIDELMSIAKGSFRSGVDPRFLAAGVKVAKAYVEYVVRPTFSDFLVRSREWLGDQYDNLQGALRTSWDQLRAAGEIPSIMDDPTDRAAMGRLARQMHRDFVEVGVPDRETRVDAVWQELQQIDPAITRIEAMDAISQYGEFRELPKGETDKIVRQDRSELQKMGQLRDMQAGRAPQATGRERRPREEITQEERDLRRQVNAAKKRGGYVVTDPQQQLESNFRATETRRLNRIADVKAALEPSGVRIPGREPPSRTAAEQKRLDELQEELDELQTKYKQKFPKTNEEQIADRLAMLERIERGVQAEVDELKLGGWQKKPVRKQPTSLEIEAKEAEIEAIRAERDELRALDPAYQADVEERSDAAYTRALTTRLAKNKERLAEMERTGVIPPKKPVRKLSKEQLKLRIDMAEVQADTAALMDRLRRSNRSRVGKVVGASGDVADLGQAVMTGLEMSAVLRQGTFYTLGFPRQAIPALVESFKAVFSRRAELAAHVDLTERPNSVSGDYDLGNLETTVMTGPLEAREELLRSRILEWLGERRGMWWLPARIPAELVLASARGFRTFGNIMRADLFDFLKEQIEASRGWTQEDAKIVGNASNLFSGRAGIGKHSVGLSRLFFAPRWVWSRALLMVGQPAWKGDAATRRAIGKVYVRWAMGMMAYGVLRHILYSLTAEDEEHEPRYELDPRSADFAKTRLGKTRVDIGAGFNQLAVVTARMVTGKTKTASGRIRSLRGEDVPFGQDDAADVAMRFARTKLAPIPSGVLDWAAGRNVVGAPRTGLQVLGERFRPMTWADIFAAEEELGVPQGTVASFEMFFGASGMTYDDKPMKRRTRRRTRPLRRE